MGEEKSGEVGGQCENSGVHCNLAENVGDTICRAEHFC